MERKRIVMASLLSAIAFPPLAHVEPSSPTPADHQTLAHCETMMRNAAKQWATLPDGVEKAAAKQQLSAARDSLSKGDATGCMSHVKNAGTAVKAK